MRSVPINFATASNEGRFKAVNGSKLVNLYPVILPGDSKTKVALYGTPGQVLFCALPTAPIQGMCVMDGELYVVTSTKFYHVKWNGEYEELDDVVCSGRVSMATNGIHVVWVNGIRGYAYSIQKGVYELKGEGWYPANTVTHQDGFFIFNRQSTGQFFISGLLSTDLNALDYATAEASPDDTLAIISDQRALWMFGTESTEVWYNNQGTLFPFARMQGAYIEKGIAAPYTAVKLDNSIFFLGADGVVYRTSGYAIAKVSAGNIEEDCLSGDLSGSYAYAYTEEGRAFYVLTIPKINRTVAFDVSTGMWFDREHSVHGRHNGHNYARCFNRHLVGDFQNGNIYALDSKAYTDDGDKIERTAIAPVLHNGRNRVTMYAIEVDMFNPGTRERTDYSYPGLLVEDTTGILLNEDGSIMRQEMPGREDEIFYVPKVRLSYSDDGGKRWSKSLEQRFGKEGAIPVRVKWGPLGQFVQRHVKITVTDPFPVMIAGVYAELEYDDQ